MILSVFVFFLFLSFSLCYLITGCYSLTFCILVVYLLLSLLFAILAGVWGKVYRQVVIWM